MSSRRYDLHLHSNASDGSLPARDVVAVAVDRGLAGIALTDHDTVAGIPEARAAAAALGVELIPGIELSCRAPETGSLHLLGYFVDADSDRLAEVEQWHRAERRRRAAAICDKLIALRGVVSLEEVEQEAAGAPITRPHIARVMVRHGLIDTVDQAFTREWLKPGGAAHVWPATFPLAEGIAAIHDAGGAAVLAHPSRWRDTDGMIAIAEQAVADGLDGVEVDHPMHDGDAVERWAAFARQHDLIQTAGSDDHGDGHAGGGIGARTVGERVVSALRERAAGHRPTA